MQVVFVPIANQKSDLSKHQRKVYCFERSWKLSTPTSPGMTINHSIFFTHNSVYEVFEPRLTLLNQRVRKQGIGTNFAFLEILFYGSYAN